MSLASDACQTRGGLSSGRLAPAQSTPAAPKRRTDHQGCTSAPGSPVYRWDLVIRGPGANSAVASTSTTTMPLRHPTAACPLYAAVPVSVPIRLAFVPAGHQTVVCAGHGLATASVSR